MSKASDKFAKVRAKIAIKELRDAGVDIDDQLIKNVNLIMEFDTAALEEGLITLLHKEYPDWTAVKRKPNNDVKSIKFMFEETHGDKE